MEYLGFMGAWIIIGVIYVVGFYHGRVRGYRELRDDILDYVKNEIEDDTTEAMKK